MATADVLYMVEFACPAEMDLETIMWWYLFAHCMFHLIRWFPKNNRLKVRFLIIIFSFGLLLPQIYVLLIKQSSRYCGQFLFEWLLVSIVLTLGMIAFTTIFVVMDPIPWEVKFGFHGYGVGCFLLGLGIIVFTSLATECNEFTPILYFTCIGLSVFCALSTAIYAILLPFWVLNKVYFNSMLDFKERSGFCYEPVKCCSCIWHV